MSAADAWSPDQPLGTETFEQSDEAFDESCRTSAAFSEAVQNAPGLDPSVQVDDRELKEAGAEFDDPEALVTLEGGIDDPDGVGGPTERTRARQGDPGGWDLDAPLVQPAGSDVG